MLIPGRWPRVAVALAAAGGSAWWMAHLAAGGAVTRAYFGTDAHAFGLLVGIALALAMVNMPEKEWMRSTRARVASLIAGGVGMGMIVTAALTPETPDAATFPGSLLLATFGAAVAVLAGVWPGSWFGRALDVRPVNWIGNRSYGLYLWHWPVLVLVLVGVQGVGPEAGVPVWAGLLALALSTAAAAASYRFIELPFRRYGFRHALRALGRRIAGRPVTRFAGLAALMVALAAIGGTTAAIVNAPHTTTAAAAIDRGQEALDGASGSSPAPTPIPESAPEETGPDGTEITAVGDSVMLASAPSLPEAFPGITVDAEVSRSIWTGPEILTRLSASGELRENVVVGLGTNGPVDRDMLEQMAQIVGPERNLILVNAHAPRDWIPGVNADLEAFAAGHRGVWIADWTGAITPHEDLLAGDGIHPGKAGGDVFAGAVGNALERAENDRLRAEKMPTRPLSGRAE